MEQHPWWQRAVIYQIYPRSFMDASGDGIGDLRGVMQRLDYLAWLGIDAIWFSPLFPSPMADFGYDVADYENINPDYGTLEDFDHLLEAAHQRGIRVLLDLVPNHTSDQHRWFQEARRSKDNPYRDWYMWKDPAPDGGRPNNWMSYFGGPAWTFDEATGQYYLHNFAPEQPELNWRNPAVEDAIFSAIRFWLKRGLDGFRMDVIDRILKDEQFRDNPPDPNWREGDLPNWRYQRVYSEGAPGTYEYMKRFRRVFDEFPDKVAVGEVAYNLSAEALARFYGDEGDGTGDALHLPFNFGLITQGWDVATIRRFVDEYEGALPAYAWPNYVLGNHDVARLATRVGPPQARVGAMLLLTLRGTPTLYYGDEIGMVNVPIPEDRIRDPQGKNRAGLNRDEVRIPMLWDAVPGAGFCPPQADPWLPLPPPDPQLNVAAQREDKNSMLALYRRLLRVRRESDALAVGAYRPVDDVPDDCFAYLRSSDDEQRLVLLNFGGESRTVALPQMGRGRVLVSTDADREGRDIDMAEFELLPDEGVIIAL